MKRGRPASAWRNAARFQTFHRGASEEWQRRFARFWESFSCWWVWLVCAAPNLLGAHLTPAHNVVHIVSGAIALYFGFAGTLSGSKDLFLVFRRRLSCARCSGIGTGHRRRSHVDAGTAALWPGRSRHSHPARHNLSSRRVVYQEDLTSLRFQVARASFVSGANASSNSKPLQPELSRGRSSMQEQDCKSCPCLVLLPLFSEPHAHPTAADSSRRKETILEIPLVERRSQRHRITPASHVPSVVAHNSQTHLAFVYPSNVSSAIRNGKLFSKTGAMYEPVRFRSKLNSNARYLWVSVKPNKCFGITYSG